MDKIKRKKFETGYCANQTGFILQGMRDKTSEYVDVVREYCEKDSNRVLIEVSCDQRENCSKNASINERYFAIWKAILCEMEKQIPEIMQLDAELISKLANAEYESIKTRKHIYDFFKEVPAKKFYIVLKDFEALKEIFPRDEEDDAIGKPFFDIYQLSAKEAEKTPIKNLSMLILSKEHYEEIVHNLQDVYVQSGLGEVYNIWNV